MEPLLDLKGRVALVTGAGRGVGRQVVLHFGQHNAGAIVINDLFQERAEEAAHEMEGLGVKVRLLPIAADVTKWDDVMSMADKAVKQFGGIDILVNNAGIPPDSLMQPLFADSTPTDWEKWIRVNLYGVLYCTRAVITGMIDKKYGKIVTVISDAGRVGEPRSAAYSAAKAGAAGFSRALAKEVGRYNINVNCVALATTRTPSTAAWLARVEEKMLKRYILPRLGEPTDAANAILFLVSDAAAWITGQTIPVNGGYTINW